MQPPVDQAALWSFIGEKVWLSLVTYVCVFVLAGARDITHRQFARVFSLRMFRQRFIASYQDTKGFFYVELFRFLSNVAICCVYVYSTYARRVSLYIAWINRAFACAFALDLILGMLFASSAVLFIFSYARFLQIFSLPSLFLAFGPNAFLHFGFLRAFSAYDSYIRLERRMVLLPFAPKKFAFRLTVQFLTLFYVLAAGIQMLEIPGDLLHPSFLATWNNEVFGGWNFFNCIYYVIVTLSTVGYGDISPKTIQGRFYAIFMIIIGIIVFSNIANDIMKETRRQRGDGSYNARIDTRHVILSGTPTLDDLVHFVTEFYADERHSNNDCDIVVLIEDPKWTDMQWYRRVATNHFLTNHITYLVGKLKNMQDLDRAGIKAADAVFILTTPGSSGEASRQDSATVMSALAIRNVRTDIPIFSQIILEESSTQINVAMRSARSAEPEPRLMFRDKMLTSSMYRGIFKDTERLEREHLAAAFRESEGSEYSTATGKQNDSDSNDFDDHTTDLLRSSFVCFQQLYSALLVANIKANGVGTLCTNMYLDNPDTAYGIDTGPSRVPWLQEYQMGAACSLAHAIIPKSLDGVRIDSIASLLLRRGVQIVATQQRGNLHFDTVLSTTIELHAGELGMFLTYLSSEHLATAVYLVGNEYENGVKFGLSRFFKSQKEKPEEEAALAVANMRRKRSRRTSSVVNLPSVAAKYHSDRTLRRRQSHIFSRNLRLDSQSFEFGGGVRQETDYYQSSDGVFDLTMNDMPGSSTGLIRSRSHWDIPPDISDHIIVAMEGDTPLNNLPFFLKLLWHKDGRFAEVGRPNVPVIIVHPQGADNYSDLFREYDRKSLFFVRGSPAVSGTWKNAKLGTAKAVATMPDYTQDWEVADSRTVYTLLTLDALTTEQQNLFICSELINEQSLDYLREPLHPRRRGARMGNPIVRHSQSLSTFTPQREGSGNDEEGESHQEVSPIEGTEKVGRTRTLNQSIDGTTSLPAEEEYLSDDFDSDFSSTVVSGPPSVKEEECATNALFSPHKEGEDVDKRPGVSRARRRELFSRFRYTSGELLVHSTADTLLVREYAEPGFVKFMTGLCGADSSSPGQKIRLVRIPKTLFREYHLVNGQRLIEYGVVFERLVALGVTPLGLYRSGDAPVRLPKFKRSKRGQQIYNEAALIQTQAATRPVRRRGDGFHPIKSLVKTGHDVLPGSVLERRGVKELLGGGHAPTNMFKRSQNDAGKFELSSTRSARQEALPVLESPEGSMNGGVAEEVHAALGATSEAASPPPNGVVKDGAAAGATTEKKTSGKKVVLPKKVAGMRLGRKTSRLSDCSVYGPAAKHERNLLPYVYTMPDINTLVAETDGVYILCDPLFEMPRVWARPPQASE